MHWIIERTVGFFVDNLPSAKGLVFGGLPALAWAWVCLHFAGHLKRHRGWKTGYTRKVFHFLIFGSVAGIQMVWGTPGVCLFGSMCTAVIFYAVWQGAGNSLYEAIAREKDEPRRTYYIVVAYFATLIGGIASNILFGPLAVVGYLVTGLGDAIGEPVGTRFGKHVYKAPSFTGVRATRSLEGSAGVLVVSVVAIAVGVILSAELQFTAWSVLALPVLGLACALVEAVSPHGWDNATMQVVPTFLARLLL